MKRILVIRTDFLGDMVCTTPLLHALKMQWPDAEIHILANKYNAPVLDGNPDVSKVHVYVYSKQFERNQRAGMFRAMLDRVALLWRLRRFHFDLLIIPNGGMDKNSIQFAYQLSVRDSRWHSKSSAFDDRNAEHVLTRPLQHEALSGFVLLPELGQREADSLRLRVYPDPQRQSEWRIRLGDALHPRIGLFISNKAACRRWPLSHWQALVQELCSEAELLIFYSPVDEPTEALRAGMSAQWISTPTVPDMIATMSLLDLVVSADSAPIHMGAGLRVPVVALFENRPEKYQRWYPLGTRYAMLHTGKIVADIPVEMVAAAARSLLAEIRGLAFMK